LKKNWKGRRKMKKGRRKDEEERKKKKGGRKKKENDWEYWGARGCKGAKSFETTNSPWVLST